MAQGGSDFSRSSIAGGHDYIFDICCDLCEQGGDYIEATGYCSDCQDYLCKDCFNIHLRPKPMRHHVLLDQHQMPKDQQQNRDGNTCTEVCTTHPHKTVEYFCYQHATLGCPVCMTLNHRNCKGVEHIPDIASDILNNTEYIEIQTKLTSLAQATSTAIHTSQEQVKRSKTYHSDVLKEFGKFKEELSKAVDRIEKNLIKQADAIKGDNETKMKAFENKYKDVLKEIQTLSSKFTSLEKNGQHCQMFIAMKRATRVIDDIESRVSRLEHGIETTKYRLMKCKEVQLLLDAPESMVKLEVVKADPQGSKPTQTVPRETRTDKTYKKAQRAAVSSPTHKAAAVDQRKAGQLAHQKKIPATPNPAAAQHSREAGKTHGKPVTTIDVRSEGDSEKLITRTGCVVMPGNTLVVVDSDNHKVKLIDLAYNYVVSQLKLADNLMGITQVGGTQVAVTAPDTQKIYILNVGNDQLKLDRTLNVKGSCRGIASINDKLVVSYDKPMKVEIISLDGTVHHTVVTEDKGKYPFTGVMNIAVSKNQQLIYISDLSNGIYSVDLTGQLQAEYQGDQNKLIGSTGITVDTSGRVYVCGHCSCSIMQLTADLAEGHELIKMSDSIVYGPFSICYCASTDRLYIGQHGRGVLIYQL